MSMGQGRKPRGRKAHCLLLYHLARTQQSQELVQTMLCLLTGNLEAFGGNVGTEAACLNPASDETPFASRKEKMVLPLGWLFRKGRDGGDSGRTNHP